MNTCRGPAPTHGSRPAISYQLLSGPAEKKVTLTWAELHAQVTQAANLFRSLGVGEKDVVAFVLPNALETAVTLLAGAVAGIVNPINPLLEPEKISAILRETNAKVVVTLKAFPKTDLPQKVAEAVKFAPNVKTVLEVDLCGYLSGLKKVIVPWLRPKNPVSHTATVKDFRAEVAKMPGDKLTFKDNHHDRVAAYFHTGGTDRHAQGRPAQGVGDDLQRLAWVEPSVQADRRGDVPAAAVPRLCLLSDPDVDDRLRRACRLSDPAGLSRRGRVRQPLEAGRTLQGHLPHHRADRPCRADAAPGQCRYLQPEERLFRLFPACRSSFTTASRKRPGSRSSKATA